MLSSIEEERERERQAPPVDRPLPRSPLPLVRQITPDDGADVGHFDPCYLPDGRIIFASTAVYQGLPCEFGAQAMTCLYLFDPMKGTIRQLTFEQDSDWCPTVLPNGRVLYQRWEYTDQSHSNSRLLFHMNPDGTDQREFRGSGSWFPGSFFYARAIPEEEHQVIGIATGHHGTPRSGRLLILDPSQGRRDGEGIVQEIPFRGRKVEPIVRDRLVDGVWPQFLMPWPLSAKYHLVAAKLRPDGLWGIYLADVFDNLTLIAEVEGAALLWPIALQKTPKPPVIPDRVNLASDEATVFITDIYAGPGLQGVPRGKVKQLRVLEYYFSRRGFGGLYGTLGADGPWDVKRILGTVPVEADGSAHFKIPANSPLSLQPLDEKGQALQLMRSWFVGMPGEAVSCSGCHEPQNEVSFNKPALAARRRANAIEPWHGPARGFSFVREVQPVLDRYCVSCHDGAGSADFQSAVSPISNRQGSGIHEASSGLQARDTADCKSALQGGRPRVPPDLRGGIMLTNWSTQLAGHWSGGGKFTTAYWELQRFVRRPGIEGDRRMFTPLDYHFSTTELGQLLAKGHHGVQLDAESWERLAAWVDLNAPFYGTWGEIPQFCNEPNGAARLAKVNARAMELRRRYVPMGPHPDYEAIPETPKYDPTPVKPLALSEISNLKSQIAEPGWPFDATEARARQREAAPAGALTRTLDLGDGVTLELARIPGGRFVMGATNGHPDETPLSVVEVQPFWMARFETSNRQFKQFKPEHESRTEDRHGYQFGRLGYDQDQPDQPAVRVSWLEAMAFCQWLSRKTGLKVTLPTEAQWEWACRAGSATPFWFGDFDADYSPFANLGDKMLAEFAADTALDHYESARPMANPNRFDDWLPRDDRFDDGGFVTEPVGRYKPNPWGLHDLHGNAGEWTRSAYRPYPYEEGDGRNALAPGQARVVRGGSWRDRPQRATASFRLAYPEYQRVFNVGFRIVCEGPAALAAQTSTQP
jgi:formylglycine-generating enzyme required for sulfatase activity